MFARHRFFNGLKARMVLKFCTASACSCRNFGDFVDFLAYFHSWEARVPELKTICGFFAALP